MAEIGRKIGPAIGLLLLIAAFLLPPAYNRHPFLFPDSLGYLRSGEVALSEVLGIDPIRTPKPKPETAQPELPAHVAPPAPAIKQASEGADPEDGVSTERSVYYGIPVYMGERTGIEWLLPIFQMLLSAGIVISLMRQFSSFPPATQYLIAAAAATLSGLSIFAGTLMPDLYGGLLVAAMAIYLVRWRSMSWRQTAFWLLVVLYSALIHKAHMAIGFGILVVAIGLMLLRLVNLRPIALLAGTLIAAALGHMLIDVVVERTTGMAPRSAPFMLARLIGDGTAVTYLREECPKKKYLLCDHLDRLPVSEVDFLWSKDPKVGFEHVLPPADRDRMHAEAGEIVNATLKRYPVRQFLVSTGNVLRQYVTVGVTRFGRPDGLEPPSVKAPSSRAVLERYADSEVMQRRLPLTGWSKLMLVAYLVGLAFIAFALVRRPAALRFSNDQYLLLFLLATGIVVNGAVSGVLSAVVDRYQGRIAWIPVLLAIVFAVRWVQGNRQSA